jgi:hypothetical protein
MSNYYSNFTLKGPSQDKIVKVLRERGCNAYITPTTKDLTVVFDAQSDDQDMATVHELGAALSSQLSCAVLGMLVHDQNVLCYCLYRGGELVDSYDSCPSYFDVHASETPPSGGKPDVLCAAFAVPRSSHLVESILRAPHGGEGDGYELESERHGALVEALHLPNWCIGAGFNHIEEGDLPPDLEAADLVRVSSD